MEGLALHAQFFGHEQPFEAFAETANQSVRFMLQHESMQAGYLVT